MKIYLKLLLAGLLAFALAMGCKKKDKTQTVAPASAGERGTSCDAKNDCGEDLSCIGGICQPANFDIKGTVKECFRVECADAKECCGDKVLEAPAKCRARTSTCSPSIPGCQADQCQSDNDCNGGVCGGFRQCEVGSGLCTSNADCAETCIPDIFGMGGAGATGNCSISGANCGNDADCTFPDACGAGFCDCANANYDPSDPICTDEDCDDICTLTCQNERCIEDNSCEDDDECIVGNRRTCANSECVECTSDDECDDEFDEDDDDDVCNDSGTCISPCKSDSECGIFSACNVDLGDCEFVGCRSDRECVLSGGAAGPGDPRLSKCVQRGGVGVCTIECELDAHCALDEVCDDGACQYIGCDTDGECKTILGLHNWETSDDIPWTPEGLCREPVAAE